VTTKVFVDTSAFYALSSERDASHTRARDTYEHAKRLQALLVTSSYVVLETISLLQKRHGIAMAERFGDSVAGGVDVVWIDAGQHHMAWKLWKEQRQRGLSLVDCSSFAVMRDVGIRHVFAFDRQFEDAGFVPFSPSADRVAERWAGYRVGRRKS